MKASQIEKLGVPHGRLVKLAVRLIGPALKGGFDKNQLRPHLTAIAKDPMAFTGDPYFGELAREMVRERERLAAAKERRASGAAAGEPMIVEHGYTPRDAPAPWKVWGAGLEPDAVQQMKNACALPVAVRGALMPDAHVGYGLPIGGVLATRGAVIPFAVGVDIACRMKLTVLDMPVDTLAKKQDWLTRAIEEETRFGVGAEFKGRHTREHQVMDQDWSITPQVQYLRESKAGAQLGTSGSGNHFVEFGVFTVKERDAAIGLEPGEYLALLSHSGSRGTGAAIADHYSKLAMKMHPDLPPELRHLAWLDLDSAEGQEYWAAMSLMGQYASANHACIHKHVVKHLGAEPLWQVENHHNFAWKETHDGEELIVHRKGATPAGAGVLGVIPGSMASPGYVVRGKGDAASLQSASHGAGRLMSRTKARATFRWAHIRDHLKERGVTVISAGLDENPMVYKNIDEVMGHQRDLVDAIARFDPELVKMAPEGEKAED